MITEKQEKFIQELIKGKSQREAYKAAYNASKMKDSTIDSKASSLLKKDKVGERYRELLQKSFAKSGKSAAEVRADLIDLNWQILQMDPTEYFEKGKDAFGNAVLRVSGDLNKKSSGKFIKEIKTNMRGEVIGVVFQDKSEAMKALERLYALDKEMTDNEVKVTINVEGADA